jgi:hypothetical protein
MGAGSPLRKFLYPDDLPEACIMIMKNILKKILVNLLK